MALSCLLLLLSCLLTACPAPPPPTATLPPPPHSPEEVAAPPEEPATQTSPEPVPSPEELAWEAFRAKATAIQAPAFSAKVSLNYASPKEKHRVVATIFGNTSLPVRLDLQAGVGAMLGHWRQDAGTFLAFLPRNNAAYQFPDALSGMAAFGLALPLDLHGLGRMLMGDWSALIPERYETASVEEAPDGPIRYGLFTSQGSMRLTLDGSPENRGVPISLELPAGDGGSPWVLAFRDMGDEGFPALTPQRVRMTREAEQEKALLFLKSLELRTTPWPAGALELEIPATVQVQEVASP